MTLVNMCGSCPHNPIKQTIVVGGAEVVPDWMQHVKNTFWNKPELAEYPEWLLKDLEKTKKLELTLEEANLCREWFGAVQDINALFLKLEDFLLAKKLHEKLEMRVPHSISNKLVSVGVSSLETPNTDKSNSSINREYKEYTEILNGGKPVPLKEYMEAVAHYQNKDMLYLIGELPVEYRHIFEKMFNTLIERMVEKQITSIPLS